MATHPGPGPTTPALVGREREQTILREALTTALAGRGGLVLIGGEAGIGKTTLAEWLLAEAEARDARVLVGRCYDLSETPPYGPWREVFGRVPGAETLPALPDAVLPIAGTGEVLASREAITGHVHAYLAALAARAPLIVLLDDLHWADPASLDLLRALARQLADLPLLLLTTYRADELTRRHPLYALLPALVREVRAARLDLRPLREADLRTMVRGYALMSPDEDRLVAYLAAHAEGNPFYAGELLRALEDEAIVAPVGPRWQLGDTASPRLPTLLRQVIDTRLARLGEGARALLAVAAIIGQEIPLTLWAMAAGIDEEALLDPAERAVEARILRDSVDGTTVSFAHALIREALYQGTSSLRRRALHRRVAEGVLAAPQPDPDTVAYHLRHANDPRAAEWLIAAGDRAAQAYALVTAGARYEAALALLETAGADPGARGWLALRLAWTFWMADPERSLAELAQVAVLAAEADDPALQVATAHQYGFQLCMVGQMRRGLAAIAAVVPALAALTPPERARAFAFLIPTQPERYDPRSVLAAWYAWTGRFADALALGVRLAPAALPDLVDSAGLRDHYADVYLGQAIAHAGLGHAEAARQAFAAARVCNRAVDNTHQLGMNARQELGWVVLPYQTERLAERRQLADEAAQAWARADETRPDVVPASATLPLLLLEGHWAEAGAIAARLHASRNSNWSRLVANAALAFLARERGELAMAWGQATEQFPAGATTEPGDLWLLDALPVLRLAALIAGDRADQATARAWLACHDRWLAWSGAVLGRAEGALGWATYHRAAGDLALARQHAETALAHATEPRQPLALLAAQRALGALDTDAGRYAEALVHLDTALALAGACAAPYERALTLLALAELRLATADRPAAQATLAEAVALLTPLEAAPALTRGAALAARLAAPPPTAPPAVLPFGLTAREAEVLRLLTDDLTDAQIAAQLFISRNTVNAHTKAIYGKLGVTTRAAAGRLATEHGLA